MKPTRYDALSAERRALTDLIYISQPDLDARIERIAQIDRELGKLARRWAARRAYRQACWDLNGHHGPA